MRWYIILFLFLFSLQNLNAALWPCLQGNQYFTGNNDETVPTRAVLNWSHTNAANIYYPVAVDDTLLFSSVDHSLTCCELHSGRVLWKYMADVPLIRSAVISGDHVIAGCGVKLLDLSLKTGIVRWSISENPVHILVQPVIDGTRVIYGTRKHVCCRDLETGRLIWDNVEMQQYGGSASVSEGRIFIQTRDYSRNEYFVAALQSDTGLVIWKNSIGKDANIFTPVEYSGNIYVSAKDQVYCFEASTGRPVWIQSPHFRITSEAVFANKMLFLAGENGQIAALDPKDGNVLKRLQFSRGKNWFAFAGDNLYVLETANASLSHVDINQWSPESFFRLEAATNGGHAFIIADGNIFFPVNNSLYAVGSELTPESQPVKKHERSILITVTDQGTNHIDAEITEEFTGQKIRSGQGPSTVLKVPAGTNVHLTVTATNYLLASINAASNQREIRVKLEPLKKALRFTINNIYFDYNKSDLKPESLPVLTALRDYLLQNASLSLGITGHTDNIGGEEFNLALSKRRAERVLGFLVKNGIDESRLVADGKGSSQPMADNSTDTGRALNRRIEFTVR